MAFVVRRMVPWQPVVLWIFLGVWARLEMVVGRDILQCMLGWIGVGGWAG